MFKSLKGKLSQRDGAHQSDGGNQDQMTNQSPEITYDDQKDMSKKHRFFGDSSKPTQIDSSSAYEPPPGPPPKFEETPESSGNNPPPYESWLSVPDNSQLPPPPSIANEYSPSNNASSNAADRGHRWCDRYPMYTPAVPSEAILNYSVNHELGLDSPPSNLLRRGSNVKQLNTTTWRVQTAAKQDDIVFTSQIPAYFAAVQNPLLRSPNTESETKTTSISFSIQINHLPSDDTAGIALGFTAKPYPPFRLPGWHRGSLAVHSDDGRRYVNDSYGGVDFMAPFQTGDTVGLKVSFVNRPSPVVPPSQYPNGGRGGRSTVAAPAVLPPCVTKVEVVRNGNVQGSWDGHEERDSENAHELGVAGLQGEGDLYVAVGCFGRVEFEVHYDMD